MLKTPKIDVLRNAHDYIPLACHYDSNTILTKNGHLIQTIQINGVNAHNISKELLDLRATIRAAIRENKELPHMSFWVHTMRSKTDLDDDTLYPTPCSDNIHKIWSKKNYLHDKFVNTLYVSFVWEAMELTINNFRDFLFSFHKDSYTALHTQHLRTAAVSLSQVVDQFCDALMQVGTKKLSVYEENGIMYSEVLSFYNKIIGMNPNDSVPVIKGDISRYLGKSPYAIGFDAMEIFRRAGATKRFVSILSVKEYQEVSENTLNLFLQKPIEFIITEIFILTQKSVVRAKLQERDKLFRINPNSNLRSLCEMEKWIDDANAIFCNQQITIALTSDNISDLEKSTTRFSEFLSAAAVMHVREDINMEKTFWAQVPGNFRFLHRLCTTLLDYTAAMTSLHNMPTGSLENPWGRAVTILRTEDGMPFFMNLHNEDDNPNVCIVGEKGVGKTILTNFLLSESMKYNPNVLYLTYGNYPRILIEINGGTWFDKVPSINPFLAIGDDLDCMIDMLHLWSDLTTEQLQPLLPYIFNIPVEQRSMESFSVMLNGSEYAAYFTDVLPGGIYHGYFNAQENALPKFFGVNLEELSSELFTQRSYPEDEDMLESFNAQCEKLKQIREAVALSIMLLHDKMNEDNTASIVVVNDIDKILVGTDSINTYGTLWQPRDNRAMIVVVRPNEGLLDNPVMQIVDGTCGTKVCMPNKRGEVHPMFQNLLSEHTMEKFKTLSVSSRLFLVDNSKIVVSVELSLGGFPGILSILNAQENDLVLYETLKATLSGDELATQLYEQIQNREVA